MIDLDRGKERLENWAAWANDDSAHLDYPKSAPYARLYRAEDGNIWDGEPLRVACNEFDAMQVDELIRGMPVEINTAVRCFYLEKMKAKLKLSRHGPTKLKQIAKACATSAEEVSKRLEFAADHVGRMALRRAG